MGVGLRPCRHNRKGTPRFSPYRNSQSRTGGHPALGCYGDGRLPHGIDLSALQGRRRSDPQGECSKARGAPRIREEPSRLRRLSIFSILGPKRAKKLSIGVYGFAEKQRKSTASLSGEVLSARHGIANPSAASSGSLAGPDSYDPTVARWRCRYPCPACR